MTKTFKTAAASLLMLGLLSTPALADDHGHDHGHDRGRDFHQAREWRHDDHGWRRPPLVVRYYAPAPVYYPQPVYYQQPVYPAYSGFFLSF